MISSVSDNVRLLEGASEAAGPLFVDSSFNCFQSRVQGKRLLEFSISNAAASSVTRLTFGGRDGVWTSPITGAFGGLTWVGEKPAISTVDELLQGATRRLVLAGAQRLTVRLPPDGYLDPSQHVQMGILIHPNLESNSG